MAGFSSQNRNRSVLDSVNRVRLVIINLIFFLFLGILIFSFVGGIASVQVKVKETADEGSVLLLNPSGSFFEDSWWSDTADMDPNYVANSYFFDVTESLRRSLFDDEIDTVLIDTSLFSGGNYPQLKEVVALLKEHKKKGNQVVAYSYSYTQAGYYIASVADKILMDQNGQLIFNGFSANNLFFGGLFEKFKIDIEIFQAGDYKSAVEPFRQSQMSQKSRENLSEWLNELWDSYLEEIAQNRGMELSQLISYADNFDQLILQSDYWKNPQQSGLLAKIALNQGLVDFLVSESINDEPEDLLKKADLQGEVISYRDYLKSNPLALTRKVAVLTVDGSIKGGMPDTPGSVGSARFADELEKLMKDKRVKAIVLRINSPGGSATASEQMRLALVEAQKNEKKPIVISFGGMAASGGYWLAMNENPIVADSATITGSIGVFGMLPSFQRSLESNLGITVDGLSVGGMGTSGPFLKMSEAQRLVIQASVDSTYGNFLDLVCHSRNLEREKLLPHAGGRVFTGRSALEAGLVDQLGSFYDAVDLAAQKANLTKYQIDFNKREKSLAEKLFEVVFRRFSPFSAKTPFSSITDRMILNKFKPFLFIEDEKGLYCRLPYQMEWNGR